MPWWAAIAIAVTATAIGFAFDAGSGSKELGTVFAVFYVVGCVMAVLGVQQSDVFTTVIQPPLILFFTVPTAYWLFHGATFNGVKNILINCGYPLIERFPLMLSTSAAVLLLGLIRWYLGTLAGTGRLDEFVAKLTSLWPGRAGGDDDRGDNNIKRTGRKPAPRTRRPRAAEGGERRERARTPARGTTPVRGTATGSAAANTRTARNGQRPGPSRGQRTVPRASDPSQRRRPRPDSLHNSEPAPEPRRRPRDAREPVRRGHGDRPQRAERPTRAERPVRADRPTRPQRAERPIRAERPVRPEGYRQATANRRGETESTHHPVSRVRYRDRAGGDAS